MPYSDYSFAMAVRHQSIEDFLYALSCCLEALGGVPQVVVPDNLKAAIIKASRYEPDINQALEDFANHYQFTVVPARVSKPLIFKNMMQIELQMNQLRLRGMARSWQAMVETRRAHELTFPEGLGILLQGEVEERANRRFDRLQKNARFRYRASIEELTYDSSRGLDKALIANLATGEYLEKGESVLITGKTGVGKSFLASALGLQACAQGYSVEYFNAQKMFLRLKMARLEGTILKFFDKLAKTKLLVIDDFGLAHLDKQQQLDLLDIMEDRHGRYSTIIASQLPVAAWYDVCGERTIADAVLDRLVHTSYRIEFNDVNLRKKL